MENKHISPEQSLQIIEQMLADSRNKFYNNGFAYIFWGFLILFAFICQYILIKMGYGQRSNIVWPFAIGIGIVVMVVYFGFLSHRKRLYSKIDSNNGIIWIGFGLSYIVLIYLCIHLAVNPAAFIWCLLGFAMFASGAIYRYKPLYFGAIIFLIGAAISVNLSSDADTLLVGAFTMLLGYIIPGILLWRKAKKEAHV